MFGEKIKYFGKKRFGTVKVLAESLKMSPQQLAAYTNESRKPGFDILANLQRLGCNLNWLLDDDKTIDELNYFINVKRKVEEKDSLNGFLDLSGAIELSRTPAPRLAQLLQVPEDVLEGWKDGSAVPSADQAVRFCNLIVALGLSRLESAADGSKEAPGKQVAG